MLRYSKYEHFLESMCIYKQNMEYDLMYFLTKVISKQKDITASQY